MHFDPSQLRRLRQRKGKTIADIADKLGISSAQVHRLEKGQRRLTVDALAEYCEALSIDLGQLFVPRPRVPIIGIVDSENEVLPLKPNTLTETIAPMIVPDMENIAAVRWEPAGRFDRMKGHLLFFYSNTQGIPENAWGNRCLIIRKQGTQRIGWPIRENGVTHLDSVESRAEFNVEITWASPILAVVPPMLIERLAAATPI